MTDNPQELQLAPFPVEPAQTECEIEGRLKDEIQALWSAHQLGRATVKHTKEELRTLRLDLGGKLYEMKSILARTGRSGGWAGYLRANALPRSSADRFVDRYETSLKPEAKRPSEAIPATTADDVRLLVRSLLPRLRRVLTTPSWVEWFLVEVQSQWESAYADSPGGGSNEFGPVAKGDSGGTDVANLSAAA